MNINLSTDDSTILCLPQVEGVPSSDKDGSEIIINNKGENMTIVERVDVANDIHIITNDPTITTGDVVYIGDNYRWGYLAQLNKLGYRFRVVNSKLKSYNEVGESVINGRHTRSCTLAYPDAGTGTWVQIRIWDTNGNLLNWGELPFIKLGNSKKMPKRLKEITRKAAFTGLVQVSIRKISADNVERITDMDGMNFVRRSVAARLANSYDLRVKVETGELVRFNFRALTGAGIIKGDAIVVPDEMIDHDIITFDDNIKDEVRFNGGSKCLITMEPHHAHSSPWTNVQRFSHLGRWLYSDSRSLVTALNNFVEEHFTALDEGKVPGWMINELATDGLAHKVTKWINSGREMTESIYLSSMVAGAIVKQLGKVRASGEPENRFPIPWAVTAHVVTHEALIEGGYDIPGEMDDWVFYHKESQSISFPGHMFLEFFERHGTWDLDDTVTVHLRWTTAGDLVGIGVRDPNSYGEYSVFPVIADTFPWYNTNQAIPVVDMNARPTYIDELNQTLTGMEPSDFVRGEVFSPVDAEFFGEGLTDTPGVGSLVNVLMAYWDTFDRAPNHAPAQLGDMVDVLQQEPDPAKLETINTYISALARHMHRSGESFDEFLFTWRLAPAFMRLKLDIEEVTTYTGSHTRRDNWYTDNTAKVTNRVNEWLAANVKPVQSILDWWNASYGEKHMAAPKRLVNFAYETYTESRNMEGDLRRRFIRARNTKQVAVCMNKEARNHEEYMVQVLGAYVYCIKHNRPDHMFFGDTLADVDMMDLLLALIDEIEEGNTQE